MFHVKHCRRNPGRAAGRGYTELSPHSLPWLHPMQRMSRLFARTLRDDPAEATVASHRLLLRAGYIRPLGAGIYSLLPLGWRVHSRAVHVVDNVQRNT